MVCGALFKDTCFERVMHECAAPRMFFAALGQSAQSLELSSRMLKRWGG